MKKIIKFTVFFLLLLILIVASIIVTLWYLWSSNLPYIGTLTEYNPPIITEIYSDDSHVIGRFWDEKRVVITLDEIPDHVIKAFIAAEDSRFFEHEGVDLRSIFRAFVKNLKAGKIEQGGSTITQQVTRSLLLKNLERTYKRKAREAILSLQIEKNFSKERILFLYMNQIYMGQGAYGIEAAARTYFDKSAKDLDIAESAMLAGLPQAPSNYSPVNNFRRAKARQKYVLERMRKEGFITEKQETEALAKELSIKKHEENVFDRAPYFTEYIRKYLEDKYGRGYLYTGGLKVYTTMDLEMQNHARSALQKGLMELDKREGYRGPVRHLSREEIELHKPKMLRDSEEKPVNTGAVMEGIVESVDDGKKVALISLGKDTGILPIKEMAWARKPDPEVPYHAVRLKSPGEALKNGDIIRCMVKGRSEDDPDKWLLSLEQEPEVQGAVIAIESKSGRVRAMVGGYDFRVSQFDRVNQSRRQPGSAFKPIIYAAALDSGMTPVSIIIDAPYVSSLDPGEDEDVWKPKNYKGRFFGPTLLRNALIHSRNVITVKILKNIGVKYAIDYARKMAIESELYPNLSLALGSCGLSLTELTAAYSIFTNGGDYYRPFFISRIEDRNGNVIEENHPVERESISEETAFVMTNILQAVINEGTGWRARELKRPAAGKTGTTNDLRDAWFIGYTPQLIAGVWVGYDDRRPMGEDETGSRAASPIWLYFMSNALSDLPVADFKAPENVIFAKIDSEKGLLASPYSQKTVFQAFIKGTEPQEYTPEPAAARSRGFSQFDMDFSQ